MVSIIVVALPPQREIPEGWTVFNAPRPLFGDVTWEGPWVSGCWFAMLDPEADGAAEKIETNRRLHAVELEYVTEEAFRIQLEEHLAWMTKEYEYTDCTDVDLDDREDYLNTCMSYQDELRRHGKELRY